MSTSRGLVTPQRAKVELPSEKETVQLAVGEGKERAEVTARVELVVCWKENHQERRT